ncbi:MAG: RES family NAD+ phosphorylase [Ginsengibacter sp.]
MIVYRITNERFKDDIYGKGAALYGGRWNFAGRPMLYTSQFISLCILESLVHLQRGQFPDTQYLLHIEIPEGLSSSEITFNRIKDRWKTETEYTQFLGDDFLKNEQSLMLKVPSVVVPQEHNFLLNPMHKDFKKTKIVSSELLELDKRLMIK